MIKKIVKNLSNLPGWRTNRKIVVIESDDWGTVRMSSSKAYQALLKSGIRVDKDPYNRFDALESSEDLSALFDTLKGFRDKNGNHPVITANTIVANPDFEKIADSNFETYHYELFTQTLLDYYGSNNTINTWKEGMDAGIFRPQFHGREHVNVAMWMNALRSNHKELLLAFQHKVFGIPMNSPGAKRGNYMAAFDVENHMDLQNVENIISDGLNIFNEIFGYSSKTIIAPCYVLPTKLAPMLIKKGVMGYQGISYQFNPVFDKSDYQRKLHYTGQKNSYGQQYLVRNAFFEPTQIFKQDMVAEIIPRMKTAFFWKKPLIIGAHRVNFIGSLDEANRKNNLEKLELVLASILKECPDVEFMSSDSLIDLMQVNKN